MAISRAHSISAGRYENVKYYITMFVAVVGGLGVTMLAVSDHLRLAITVAVIVLVVGASVVRVQLGIALVIGYLVVMGDLRRILIPFAGWGETDPLLLIAPIFVVAMCAYAWSSRQVKMDSPMAKTVMALVVVMCLSMFNPKQGGLMVGVGGGLFYLVPLMWFFVGRSFATPDFMRSMFFKVLIPLAVLAALMGYYQVFYGYLPYQNMWYDIAGYTSLGAVGHRAPISFFPSSTEYGNFMIVACVILWVPVIMKGQKPLLIAILFFFVAVYLTGSRGPIARLLVTCAALWAMLGRDMATWMLRGSIGLVIGTVGLVYALGQAGNIQSENENVTHRMGRQSEGLLGITEENSSARGHLGMMFHGYEVGLRNPLGNGLGSTTKAATKFGGEGASTEVDASNVFVSTGVVGGVLYHMVIYFIFVSIVGYWKRTRDPLALIMAGVLIVLFLMWLQGGQYAMSSIIWLTVGALDRFQNVPGGDSS